MKIKNIKKLLINNLILCGSLLLTLSIESNAIDGDLDLTRKSIVRNLGGSNTDYFSPSIETSDGGLVVAGHSNSTNAGFNNEGGYDAVIIKYDGYGNQEWIKSFGGSGNDFFNSIVETSDGGIVAVGRSSSTNAGFSNKGGFDAIAVKYDKDGNELWVKNFGGSNNDYFNSVIETSDKGIVTVGHSYSTNIGFNNEGNMDAIIMKYDKDGNQLWVKNFGGLGNDIFNSIIEISDGELVIVGGSNSTNAGFTGRGGFDGIITKYDGDGNQLWIKNFGGSGNDEFYLEIETSDGGIIAVGCSYSINAGFNSKGNMDGIIVKYDDNGNQLWVKNFGGSDDDNFKSVIETSDKGIIAVGYSESTDAGFSNKGGFDAVIVKYDRDGNQLWVKNFGGSGDDCFYSIIETRDGGVVSVGESWSEDAGFSNKGGSDATIVKYNEDCKNNEYIFDKVYDLEITDGNAEDLEEVRGLVNSIQNEEIRSYLNKKLDSFNIGFGKLERKSVTSNLDLYIKCENMLLMSLDTSSVTFEDFSGVEDMEMLGAVNISINSSLPYQLNVYLPVEMQNSDKSATLPIDILNIRESSESDYKQFANTTDKVVLKDNCLKGNDKIHTIDLKLASNLAHKADIYKTVIKFEAEQK